MQIPANIALVKNLTLHGVFWGSYMQNNPRVLQQSLMELVSWLDEGRITVPVSHRCTRKLSPSLLLREDLNQMQVTVKHRPFLQQIHLYSRLWVNCT